MAGVRVLQGALAMKYPPVTKNEWYWGETFSSMEKLSKTSKGEIIVAKNEQKKSNRPDVTAKEEQTGFSAIEFLKETKEQLDKIVWPSRKQLISESAGVILMVTLVATIIYLFDNLFIWIAGQVFG